MTIDRLRQRLDNSMTVTASARGEADPWQPNDTAEHRQFNRRAIITLR